MATSIIKNSEYFKSGEQITISGVYLFGMSNGNGNAVIFAVMLPKRIPTNAVIGVSGSISSVRSSDGVLITSGMTLESTASRSGDCIANMTVRLSGVGSNKLCNVVPISITLTFTI